VSFFLYGKRKKVSQIYSNYKIASLHLFYKKKEPRFSTHKVTLYMTDMTDTKQRKREREPCVRSGHKPTAHVVLGE